MSNKELGLVVNPIEEIIIELGGKYIGIKDSILYFTNNRNKLIELPLSEISDHIVRNSFVTN